MRCSRAGDSRQASAQDVFNISNVQSSTLKGAKRAQHQRLDDSSALRRLSWLFTLPLILQVVG